MMPTTTPRPVSRRRQARSAPTARTAHQGAPGGPRGSAVRAARTVACGTDSMSIAATSGRRASALIARAVPSQLLEQRPEGGLALAGEVAQRRDHEPAALRAAEVSLGE